MADIWSPNNPGISGLKELTSAELAAVQAFGALGDPNVNAFVGWDDTDNTYKYFLFGSGISYDHSTHTVSISAGTGDVSSNTSSSVDGEVALFSGTGGKTIKRATGSGIAKLTSGVLGTATAGTDYLSPAGTETVTNKDLTSGTNTFPTFNQNTTGSAAKWTTARNLAGNSVDGSANVAFSNKFIVQGTTDAGLSAAQFLGALGTGIVKNTTTTGVLSIAVNSDLPTMTATVGGAVPTPPNNTTTFLRGDGTFASIPSGGTVTNTGGNLTANAIVLGAGTVDTKVVAGIITDGTSVITLGVNTTTIGKLKMFGNTSGDATIQPTAIAGTATVQTLPATTGTLVNRVTTGNGVSASNTDGALSFTLGAITPSTVNGNTFTTGTYTLTGTAGKTLNFTNSITLSGTDATTMTFPTTSATLARTDAANTFIGASTASAWVLTSPTITTGIVPTSNDGAALGSTANQFSDLFVASGAVINFANGNVTITHTSGVLTMGTSMDLKLTTAGTTTTSVTLNGGTQTLTNKRINPRIDSTASSSTPTPVGDSDDLYEVTALAANATIGTPGGTPVDGQKLVIRIKDNGTARTLAFNAIYRASSDLALPSTTVLSKTMYLGFLYNSADSKWDFVSFLNNF